MQLVMDADRLELWLEGLEHLWAFKLAPISIPLAHVVRAEARLPPRTFRLRAPGTGVPGLIQAGTYHTPQGREFWYVVRGRGKEPLSIELEGERYRRLVLSIEGADGWAARINALRAG